MQADLPAVHDVKDLSSAEQRRIRAIEVYIAEVDELLDLLVYDITMANFFFAAADQRYAEGIQEEDQLAEVASSALSSSIDATADTSTSTPRLFAVFGSIATILSLVVSALVIRSITSPIQNMTRAMTRLSNGRSASIPGVGRSDEIGKMAEAVAKFRTKTDQAKQLAERRALTDTLTGLPNRRALTQFTEELLLPTNAKRLPGYLLHIDLDRFKRVNDTFGHAAGDVVLRNVTAHLTAAIGDDGIAARIGGDEFVLILTQSQSVSDVEAFTKDLVAGICAPVEFSGQLLDVGASVGITHIRPDSQKTLDELLLEGDLALYDVKKAGRGTTKLFSDEMKERENIFQELTRDIGPALEQGEFIPFFQLQVDTRSCLVYGVEVLGRWVHPKHGIISPGRFLYVSERARLTESIDRSIYVQALDQFARWKKQGIAPNHISLNLTGRTLCDTSFVDWMHSQVRAREICPSEVVFELVETILIDGVGDGALHSINVLAEAGFRLAIDDFGTGHASLSSLISVPVKLIKIDRTFVTNIHQSAQLALLTKAMIDVAKGFEIDVLVEGLETEEERAVIESLGCTLFQGFLFGRPAEAREITKALRTPLRIAQPPCLLVEAEAFRRSA